MPVRNPAEHTIRFEGNVYAFTDIGFNRGVLAVKEFLQHKQAELLPAMLIRLVASAYAIETMRSEPRFERFFRIDAERNEPQMASALIEAFATAGFLEGALEFDLEDVGRVADLAIF